MKRISLSDNDKKRLRDAFEAAVNAEPLADTPVVGLTEDGSKITPRQAFKEALDNGQIFSMAEAMLSTGGTVDGIIAGLKKTGLGIPPQP